MNMPIFVARIIVGRWDTNCYVVHKGNGDAMIIDPGDQVERIMDYVESKRLKILAILATHGHHDHIGAVTTLKARFSAPFYLHSRDVKLLKYANLYRKIFDGHDPRVLPSVDYYIDKVEVPVRVGDFSIGIVAAPGHTEGGVCFLIENHLFTGDTLLRGKIGRVDLAEGDRTSLYNSVRRLMVLPPETKVYPGHGETTTLSQERENSAELRKAIGEE